MIDLMRDREKQVFEKKFIFSCHKKYHCHKNQNFIFVTQKNTIDAGYRDSYKKMSQAKIIFVTLKTQYLCGFTGKCHRN